MSLIEVRNAVFAYVPDYEVLTLQAVPFDDPFLVIRLCAAIRKHRVILPRRAMTSLISYLDETRGVARESARDVLVSYDASR